MIIDSWRALPRVATPPGHAARFVAATGLDPADVARAVVAIETEVAGRGEECFPRLECAEGVLGWRVRAAPPRRERAVLVGAVADERVDPVRKGVDLAWLMSTREAAARVVRDDEAVVDAVLTRAGRVVEGTAGTLLLDGPDGLVELGDAPRLPSTTVAALRTLGRITGAPRAVRVAELDGCALLWVNALHGVTGVVRWLDDSGDVLVDVAPPDPQRVADVGRALAALWSWP